MGRARLLPCCGSDFPRVPRSERNHRNQMCLLRIVSVACGCSLDRRGEGYQTNKLCARCRPPRASCLELAAASPLLNPLLPRLLACLAACCFLLSRLLNLLVRMSDTMVYGALDIHSL